MPEISRFLPPVRPKYLLTFLVVHRRSPSEDGKPVTMNLKRLPPAVWMIALLACIAWQFAIHPPTARAADLGQSVMVAGAPAYGSTAPAPSWVMPIAVPALLVHQFRSPNSDYSSGHRGVDYAVTDGQDLMSPSAGNLVFTGMVADKPVVSILHSGGFRTTFEPACSTLPRGTTVLAGQRFGSVCAKGYQSHCKPSLCLHFAMKLGEQYLSPLALIGGLAPSVLVR
jgi:murein DD-endopeptidase MepM/ murein hydrolase activator NlpD